MFTAARLTSGPDGGWLRSRRRVTEAAVVSFVEARQPAAIIIIL